MANVTLSTRELSSAEPLVGTYYIITVDEMNGNS